MPPIVRGFQRGKKKEDEIIQPVTPAFQSRRTLAVHVKDIMNCAGRNSYYLRIILICKHKETTIDALRKQYMRYVKETNQFVNDVKLSGLIILSDLYSMVMVESTEDVVSVFLTKVAEVSEQLYESTKIVLIYNNANQRFFRKVLFRTAEIPNPTVQIDPSAFDVNEEQTGLMIRKVYELSKIVHDEEADETISFKSTYLGSEHNKLLPDKAHLEFVLNITKLMTLVDYSNLYGKLPHIDKYKEVVWPLPFDFVPNNVFDWEKYDINLTFGNKK